MHEDQIQKPFHAENVFENKESIMSKVSDLRAKINFAKGIDPEFKVTTDDLQQAEDERNDDFEEPKTIMFLREVCA